MLNNVIFIVPNYVLFFLNSNSQNNKNQNKGKNNNQNKNNKNNNNNNNNNNKKDNNKTDNSKWDIFYKGVHDLVKIISSNKAGPGYTLESFSLRLHYRFMVFFLLNCYVITS